MFEDFFRFLRQINIVSEFMREFWIKAMLKYLREKLKISWKKS